MMKLLLVLLALFLTVHCQDVSDEEAAGPAEEAVADDTAGDWDGDYGDYDYGSSGRGFALAGVLFVSALVAAIY